MKTVVLYFFRGENSLFSINDPFLSLLNCIVNIHADIWKVRRTGKSEGLQKLEFTGRHCVGKEVLCLSKALRMQHARGREEEDTEEEEQEEEGDVQKSVLRRGCARTPPPLASLEHSSLPAA